MADLTFRFLCGLRLYHVYRNVWTPKQQEFLDARQESNNPYDRYAIAAWNRATAPSPNKVVGHFPNEIFRFTWYIIITYNPWSYYYCASCICEIHEIATDLWRTGDTR